MFHSSFNDSNPHDQQITRNKLLDYIKNDGIKDFNHLKNWLKTFKHIVETQPDEFLKTFLEVNPKYFTYAYHFLTENKDITFKQAMLPKKPPEINSDEQDIDKKLRQAVEFFRIKQENIVEENKDNDAKLDELTNEINNYFAPYVFFIEKFKFYQIEALSGLNQNRKIVNIDEPGKTYYVSTDSKVNINNFSDLLILLKDPKVKIEKDFPSKNSYYTVVVDPNVSDLTKVNLQQIRQCSSIKCKYNKAKSRNEMEIHPIQNNSMENKSREEVNLLWPKKEYNLMAMSANQIIAAIEKHIRELKSSIVYSSATKAKVESFEDLVRMIKSKSDDVSSASVIKRWEENDSRSFNNKTISFKNNMDKYEEGKLINVKNLMKLECGFFTSYKSSENTKSMQLINKIKDIAKVETQVRSTLKSQK